MLKSLSIHDYDAHPLKRLISAIRKHAFELIYRVKRFSDIKVKEKRYLNS